MRRPKSRFSPRVQRGTRCFCRRRRNPSAVLRREPRCLGSLFQREGGAQAPGEEHGARPEPVEWRERAVAIGSRLGRAWARCAWAQSVPFGRNGQAAPLKRWGRRSGGPKKGEPRASRPGAKGWGWAAAQRGRSGDGLGRLSGGRGAGGDGGADRCAAELSRVTAGRRAAGRRGYARWRMGRPDSTMKLARVLSGAPGLVTKGTVR